jgi:hypothetical protein
MRDRNPRLPPDAKEGGGWRASGDEVLRVSFGELVWLQNKACKGVREVRRDGGGRLEGEREYGGHRRWRIFTGNARRDCGVRRSISAALGHDSERRGGGNEEEVTGYL